MAARLALEVMTKWTCDRFIIVLVILIAGPSRNCIGTSVCVGYRISSSSSSSESEYKMTSDSNFL